MVRMKERREKIEVSCCTVKFQITESMFNVTLNLQTPSSFDGELQV